MFELRNSLRNRAKDLTQRAHHRTARRVRIRERTARRVHGDESICEPARPGPQSSGSLAMAIKSKAGRKVRRAEGAAHRILGQWFWASTARLRPCPDLARYSSGAAANSMRLRPARFAAYRAASACFNNFAKSGAFLPWKPAMPKLAVT
jgi:hypothetical protein